MGKVTGLNIIIRETYVFFVLYSSGLACDVASSHFIVMVCVSFIQLNCKSFKWWDFYLSYLSRGQQNA